MSWTGSESQRKEQGGCAAPMGRIGATGNRFSEGRRIGGLEYVVPLGTEIFIRKRTGSTAARWYRTTREVVFQERECVQEHNGYMVFRQHGYEVKVLKQLVIHRKT